jgi:hypothetical protein
MFLFFAHSGWRYVVVAVAVLALVWYLLSLLDVANDSRLDRLAMLGFTIALDIQLLLGLLLLVERILAGAFYPQMLLHTVVMFVALGLTHSARRWRDAERPVMLRNNLLVIIGVSVLVFIGVILLPGGITRWGIQS